MCESCRNGGKPLAAVWWRVSTEDQRERISPETQVDAARTILEKQGYSVPPSRIIGTDWASLQLLDCPEFNSLIDWVAARAIHAIAVYDRDRLPGEPGARSYFFMVCKSKSVEMFSPGGKISLDGHIEKATEYLLSWAKEEQVLRAQQASKDGLRDRARLKGLPTCGKAPFGYSWTLDRKKLIPNERYDDAHKIWDLALEGMPLRRITFTLFELGIVSPTGKPGWSISVVHNMLTHPAYYGEYYALRMEVREPKNRIRRHSYGKSSWRFSDPNSWIKLPVVVEQPIVTKAQFDAIQECFKENIA